jgi:hypothetical protein
VPAGTPLGSYQVEVGWYRFVDGQPVWLPWTSGNLLSLGGVEVVAPEDWQALAYPEAAYSVGVDLGQDVRLLGFDAPMLEAQPGSTLHLDILWLTLQDGPEAIPPVVQLRDDAGQVLVEMASAPVGGRAPLARMVEGQVVRDPVVLGLPSDLAPGVYSLVVGRRRADGSWLPVRRGLFPLGSVYPMATVRILEQKAQ